MVEMKVTVNQKNNNIHPILIIVHSGAPTNSDPRVMTVRVLEHTVEDYQGIRCSFSF